MRLLTLLLSLAPAPPEVVSGAGTVSQHVEFSPPVALGQLTIAPPEGAPPLETPLHLEATLRVSTDGQVERVTLQTKGTTPYHRALLLGATFFRFQPGLYRGKPVAVDIQFRQTFLPPPETPRAATGELWGEVRERGTGKPLPGAMVIAKRDGQQWSTQADPDAKFRLSLGAGQYELNVVYAASKPFVVQETIVVDQAIEVRYLVERDDYNPYESIIVAQAARTEMSRVSLQGRELTQVPGTFGDPFRVITTMPGVGQVFSLLGYSIVRGTSPGNTGVFIDHVKVPQLFHLLSGPAVIHPQFIDRIEFYPGNLPIRFGGYTGGIVNGLTRPSNPDELRIDANANLLASGLFVQGPLDSENRFTGTVAGRLGYPGLMISLFSEDTFLNYWDYQARFEARLDGGRLSLFAFGAFDELGNTGPGGESTTSFRSQFHRVAVAYTKLGRLRWDARVVLGIDDFLPNSETQPLRTLQTQPSLRLNWRVFDALQLRAGLEANAHTSRQQALAITGGGGEVFTSNLFSGGGYVEAPWAPTDDWLITPGVRMDMYANDSTDKLGIDVRGSVRYRIRGTEAQRQGEVWLKAGSGTFHQPPRFVVPFPTFEDFALTQGLEEAVQTSAGVEWRILDDLLLDSQAYFNWLDPLLLDITVNNFDTGIDNPEQVDFLARRVGRSFGLETLIKHDGDERLFGWVSYTLSRSERNINGQWFRFDFDRTHMLQVVAGWRLPRNWEVGTRIQLQSGRPVSSEFGYNDRTLPPFFRADIRVDKRAVWNDWLLDFYVEILNVTVAEEVVSSSGDGFRFPLPLVGIQAVF